MNLHDLYAVLNDRIVNAIYRLHLKNFGRHGTLIDTFMQAWSREKWRRKKTLAHIELGSGALDKERRRQREQTFLCDLLVTVDLDRQMRPDVIADCHLLPFRNDCFDSARADSLIEHVKEPTVVIAEIFRVLDGNGIVLIGCPFIWNEHHYPMHYVNFSRQGVEYLLAKNGFDDVYIDTTPFSGLFQTVTMILSFAKARPSTIAVPLNMLIYSLIRLAATCKFLDNWLQGDSLYTFVLAVAVKKGRYLTELEILKALGHLLLVWSYRPDLQKVYPEVRSGDFRALARWGSQVVTTAEDSSHEALKRWSAWYTLLGIYFSRPDLAKAFPEVVSYDFERLVLWVRETLQTRIDSDFPKLEPFQSTLARNDAFE